MANTWDRKGVIEEVRKRTDIVQLVGEVVTLKRAGKRFVGLCPFHSEKTPSFGVDPARGLFYCFGCQAGGTVFDFLMRLTGASFREALRELGRRAGVEVEIGDESEEARKRRGERESEREQMYGALAVAARLFQQALAHDTLGERARAYVEARGLGAEVVARAGVGYAPARWDAMVKALAREGVPFAVAERVGLTARRRNGEYYDRFRGRVMFPIADVRGRVIGFGGRVLPGDLPLDEEKDAPKFLNSPESPLFSKGTNLYGLNLARETIRKENVAILVEGYFDVLALNQHGIWNVVAPLGTACTREQVEVLSRFARTVVVVFDGDAAGERAALKAQRPFLEVGVDARVVVLPKGDDPDDFVIREGAEAFLKLVREATPIVDFAIASGTGAIDGTIASRVHAAEALAPLVAAIGNPLERALYVKRISERLSIDEAQIGKLVRSAAGLDRDREERPGQVQQVQNEQRDEPRREGLPSAEERLVALLLEFPALSRRLSLLELKFAFRDQELWAVVERIRQAIDSDGDVVAGAILAEGTPPAVRARLLANLVGGESTSQETAEREIGDCVRKIQEDLLSVESREIGRAIREAESRGDEATVVRLVAQKADVARRLKSVRTSPRVWETPRGGNA